MANNNPEDERAHARSEMGLTRELEQERSQLPHPAKGGTRGYPVWYRMEELAKHAAGIDTLG
jgi:hypothetical protein